MALVEAEGRIVAFANLWQAPAGNELSVDLMRHVANLPYGVMDYLFIRLMDHARAKGYRRFTLGIENLTNKQYILTWSQVPGFRNYWAGRGRMYSFTYEYTF